MLTDKNKQDLIDVENILHLAPNDLYESMRERSELDKRSAVEKALEEEQQQQKQAREVGEFRDYSDLIAGQDPQQQIDQLPDDQLEYQADLMREMDKTIPEPQQAPVMVESETVFADAVAADVYKDLALYLKNTFDIDSDSIQSIANQAANQAAQSVVKLLSQVDEARSGAPINPPRLVRKEQDPVMESKEIQAMGIEDQLVAQEIQMLDELNQRLNLKR